MALLIFYINHGKDAPPQLSIEPSPTRISRSFSSDGVKKIILRAAMIETCEVNTDPAADAVEVSGLPAGGAKGYHSPDPNWRETPASAWGLDFVAARYGDLLVISTENEIHYIHHSYYLDSVKLRVPENVEVVLKPRERSGNGQPNLEAPNP